MRQICRFGKGALIGSNGQIWMLEPGAEPHLLFKITEDCNSSVLSINSIALSPDSNKLAVLDRKMLFLYNANTSTVIGKLELPRAASEIRFTPNSQYVLVADKTGDGYLVNIEAIDSKPLQVVGHLSMLLDILMSDDMKYIMTCDRDEKIKVFHYPHTFEIQSFCLGHTEFVIQMDFLPHDKNYLVSASGDGTVKLWNYLTGKEVLSINVNKQLDDDLITNFKQKMKQDDMNVENLPINYMTCSKKSEVTSLIAVSNYSAKCVLFYCIESADSTLTYKLHAKLKLNDEPTSFIINENKFWIYFMCNRVYVQEWDLKNLDKEMFSYTLLNNVCDVKSDENCGLLALYKRKFDNVQEYQIRKKKRLESKA